MHINMISLNTFLTLGKSVQTKSHCDSVFMWIFHLVFALGILYFECLNLFALFFFFFFPLSLLPSLFVSKRALFNTHKPPGLVLT